MKMPWPEASKQEQEGEWSISRAFLRKIQENISEHEGAGYAPSTQQLETVLLALVRLNLVPREKDANVPLNLPPHQLGWLCPACGRGNAPMTATCPCRG